MLHFAKSEGQHGTFHVTPHFLGNATLNIPCCPTLLSILQLFCPRYRKLLANIENFGNIFVLMYFMIIILLDKEESLYCV